MSEAKRPAAKRIGRPLKDPSGGKRVNVMFRLSEAKRDRLMRAAEENGRSMSEEIERRLDQSFDGIDMLVSYFGRDETLQLAQAVSMLARAVERRTGQSWTSDAATKGHLCVAIGRFMTVFFYEDTSSPVKTAFPPLGGDNYGWQAAEFVAEAMGLHSEARRQMEAFLTTPEGKAAMSRVQAQIESTPTQN